MLNRNALISRFALFSFSLWLGLVSSSQAAEPLKLHLAGPMFAPYYDFGDNNKPTGELVQLYALIVEQAGFKWDGAIIPAKRVMKALADGVYDSSILVKNPLLEQSGNILSSPVPVSELILNVYYHDMLPEPASDAALLGKKVVVMRGYGYGGLRAWLDEPRNNITLFEIDSFSSAIRLIETGRADYALLYDVNFSAGEKELGRKAEGIRSYNLQRVPLYIHLNKTQIANAEQVMAQLMTSYHQLLKLGVLASSSSAPDQVIKSVYPSR